MSAASEPQKSRDRYGIIARTEQLRKVSGLNKSRFCGLFGMTPQTYNNFIGAQGSKPNIELVMGVISAFREYGRGRLNLEWFLFGEGEMFLPGDGAPIRRHVTLHRVATEFRSAATALQNAGKLLAGLQS